MWPISKGTYAITGLHWMIENPAEYNFEDIEIGQKKSFKITITESMLEEFANLSGDHNPLHMDEIYAKSTSFKKRVCHGLLLASFFSQLVGMHLPGRNALYISQSLMFVSPCFVNDEVVVEGEVLDKSIATKIITLKTTITSSSGNNLIDGQAKVLVRS